MGESNHEGPTREIGRVKPLVCVGRIVRNVGVGWSSIHQMISLSRPSSFDIAAAARMGLASEAGVTLSSGKNVQSRYCSDGDPGSSKVWQGLPPGGAQAMLDRIGFFSIASDSGHHRTDGDQEEKRRGKHPLDRTRPMKRRELHQGGHRRSYHLPMSSFHRSGWAATKVRIISMHSGSARRPPSRRCRGAIPATIGRARGRRGS